MTESQKWYRISETQLQNLKDAPKQEQADEMAENIKRQRIRNNTSDKVLDDFDLINIIKKRYRKEPVVLDALENVEDEILAIQQQQGERERG